MMLQALLLVTDHQTPLIGSEQQFIRLFSAVISSTLQSPLPELPDLLDLSELPELPKLYQPHHTAVSATLILIHQYAGKFR